MRLWGYGVMGLWGYKVMGLWGYKVMGVWGGENLNQLNLVDLFKFYLKFTK